HGKLIRPELVNNGDGINSMRIDVNVAPLTNNSYPIYGLICATQKNTAANIAAIGFAPRLYHRDRFDAPPVVVQIFDNLQRPQPDLEQIEDMRRQINQRSTAGGPRRAARESTAARLMGKSHTDSCDSKRSGPPRIPSRSAFVTNAVEPKNRRTSPQAMTRPASSATEIISRASDEEIARGFSQRT